MCQMDKQTNIRETFWGSRFILWIIPWSLKIKKFEPFEGQSSAKNKNISSLHFAASGGHDSIREKRKAKWEKTQIPTANI